MARQELPGLEDEDPKANHDGSILRGDLSENALQVTMATQPSPVSPARSPLGDGGPSIEVRNDKIFLGGVVQLGRILEMA